MRYFTIKTALLWAMLFGAVPAQADPVRDAPSIPFSSIASPEARRGWEARVVSLPKSVGKKFRRIDRVTAEERRALFLEKRTGDKADNWEPLLAKHKAAYKAGIAPATIGGIYTEIFTPVSEVLPSNADRVLINLHDGGFESGARIGGQVESIPISAVAGIKVISINYPQAPKFQFPAATDDVLADHRELLKTYKPGSIGIYGCSAVGTLATRVAAAIIAQKMPRPGAIGMFCGTGEVWAKGDSAYVWALLNGFPLTSWEHDPQTYEYLRGLDTNNPLILPMRYPEHLSSLPPFLFIAGTLAFDMSTLADADNKRAKAGVDTNLHIWDGVTHAFLFFFGPMDPIRGLPFRAAPF